MRSKQRGTIRGAGDRVERDEGQDLMPEIAPSVPGSEAAELDRQADGNETAVIHCAKAGKKQGQGHGQWQGQRQGTAARLGLRCVEVPVRCRKRLGRSRISGTVCGSLQGGTQILWTVALHAR